MNKIKFRGRGLKDKKLYYGSYVHTMPQSSFPAIIDNGGFYNEVDPDSVAQFVGYDADGKEIYEGDKMISTINSDFETTAYLDVFPEQDSELRPDTFTKFVLKECGENENLS